MEYKFLTQNSSGVIFSVRLTPNSSFSKIIGYTDEFVRIKISAPPVDNRANKELAAFCSDLFGVNKSKIEIISGEKSKIKKILIKGENIETVTQKLMFVLNSL